MIAAPKQIEAGARLKMWPVGGVCPSIQSMPRRPIGAGPGRSPMSLLRSMLTTYLYWQSEVYAREGVEIERSTLAEWVGCQLTPYNRKSWRPSRGRSTFRRLLALSWCSLQIHVRSRNQPRSGQPVTSTASR